MCIRSSAKTACLVGSFLTKRGWGVAQILSCGHLYRLSPLTDPSPRFLTNTFTGIKEAHSHLGLSVPTTETCQFIWHLSVCCASRTQDVHLLSFLDRLNTPHTLTGLHYRLYWKSFKLEILTMTVGVVFYFHLKNIKSSI